MSDDIGAYVYILRDWRTEYLIIFYNMKVLYVMAYVVNEKEKCEKRIMRLLMVTTNHRAKRVRRACVMRKNVYMFITLYTAMRVAYPSRARECPLCSRKKYAMRAAYVWRVRYRTTTDDRGSDVWASRWHTVLSEHQRICYAAMLKVVAEFMLILKVYIMSQVFIIFHATHMMIIMPLSIYFLVWSMLVYAAISRHATLFFSSSHASCCLPFSLLLLLFVVTPYHSCFLHVRRLLLPRRQKLKPHRE